MNIHGNKKFKLAAWLLLSAAALFVLLVLLLMFAPPGRLKTALLKTFPYPLALVNGHAIYTKDYLQRLASAQKFYEQTGQSPDQDLKTQIFGQMLEEAEVSQLAASRGVYVNSAEVNAEYERLQKQDPNMAGNLPNLGLSAADFKTQVLKPQLLKQHLKIWFNSQRELNPQSYQTADLVMQQLAQGQDFAAVAKSFSQDPAGSSLGGNAAIETSLLLPEIREAVDAAKDGEVKLAVSRDGLIIFKVLGRDNSGGLPKILLQSISIKPENFDSWLNQETKKFNVKKLTKISRLRAAENLG